MHRRHLLLLGLLTTAARPAAGQALPLRPPIRPPSPQPPTAALVEAARLNGTVAYALRDLTTGALLDAVEADRPVPPASTLKVVTALYALDRLGGGHRFTTRILRDRDRLILAGGGDPTLDTDRLAVLARDTAAALVGDRGPTRLAVWGGALPRVGQLDPAQEAHLPYNPTLSGLVLNFNRVHLDWRVADGSPRLTLQAQGEAVSAPARSIRVEAIRRTAPAFAWAETPEGELWTVSDAALGRSGSRWLPVRRPERYAGDILRGLLRAEGLALAPAEVLDQLPPAAVEVARSDSADLSTILRGMLAYSNNLTAEVVGLAASGAGDRSAGDWSAGGAGAIARSAGLMRDWAVAALPGAGFESAHVADHSGLSADSRVTAAGMAALMAGPGRARGLRAMLKDVPLIDAKGHPRQAPLRVLAKSGTLNFVSNLTGYAARTGPGRDLAFAVYCLDAPRWAASEGQELPDGLIGWTDRARRLQGRLVEGWSADFGAPDLPPGAETRG